ncbi:hypothetical protein ACLKA7_010679 [Drosophila subpalustris]
MASNFAQRQLANTLRHYGNRWQGVKATHVAYRLTSWPTTCCSQMLKTIEVTCAIPMTILLLTGAERKRGRGERKQGSKQRSDKSLQLTTATSYCGTRVGFETPPPAPATATMARWRLPPKC